MELTLEMRTSSTADIGAELIQRVERVELIAVLIHLDKGATSSNLTNTYIKTLKKQAPLPRARWS